MNLQKLNEMRILRPEKAETKRTAWALMVSFALYKSISIWVRVDEREINRKHRLAR